MKRLMLGAALALTIAGCGGGQTENCKKWVACTSKTNPDTAAQAQAEYGPNGTCFTGITNDVCDALCQTGLEAAKTSYPNVAECK